MALDDVAVFSLVVVVGKCCFHTEVHHRGVADAVPSLVNADGAVIYLFDDGSRDGERDIVVYFHCVSTLYGETQFVHVA